MRRLFPFPFPAGQSLFRAAMVAAVVSVSGPAWANSPEAARSLRDGSLVIKARLDGLAAQVSGAATGAFDASGAETSEDVPYADKQAIPFLLKSSERLLRAAEAADLALAALVGLEPAKGNSAFAQACAFSKQAVHFIDQTRKFAAKPARAPGDSALLQAQDPLLATSQAEALALNQAVGCR